MGIPIPPPLPPSPGADCPACTPTPFPVGATPAFVHAVFHNITALPGYPNPPNDIPIEIPQQPANPCLWNGDFDYDGVIWTIAYRADLGYLWLHNDEPDHNDYFTDTIDPCTPGPFTNELIAPPAGGSGGTAYVLDLPLDYVMLLADDYNLLPDPRGLYDEFDSATPDHKCVRLTGRTYPGSVLIDLDLGAL
jgi:hypothetical protein